MTENNINVLVVSPVIPCHAVPESDGYKINLAAQPWSARQHLQVLIAVCHQA